MTKDSDFTIGKAFDQKLFDLHVPVSVSATWECMSQFGWGELAIPIQELGDHDGSIPIIDRNGMNIVVWSQVKNVWKCKGKWALKWRTLDIEARKAALESNVISMVNTHGDTLAMAKTSDVFSSKTRTKNTRNETNGQRTTKELFFTTPLNDWKFYTKANCEKWKLVHYEGEK